MAAGPAERWIVVLRDGSDSHRMAAEHSRAHGAQVDHVYRHALRGYAAVIPNERVAAVRSDARVAYLERDGVAIAGPDAPWGIDKVEADLSSTHAGDGSGAVSNVNVYVVDTGVDRPTLTSTWSTTSTSPGTGTPTATATARTFPAYRRARQRLDVVGVAPGAPVTGVRVLGLLPGLATGRDRRRECRKHVVA